MIREHVVWGGQKNDHEPATKTEIETKKEDLETPAPKRRKLKGVHSNKNIIRTLAGRSCTCSAKERRMARTDNNQRWRDKGNIGQEPGLRSQKKESGPVRPPQTIQSPTKQGICPRSVISPLLRCQKRQTEKECRKQPLLDQYQQAKLNKTITST